MKTIATPPPVSGFTDEQIELLRGEIPERAKEIETDMVAFWRELPRLLTDGNEGRYALVYGGQVISVWDTMGDAVQAGADKFGPLAKCLTPPIKQRDLDRWLQYLATK